MDLKALQEAVREQGADAWLFYDHHHRDPIANRILGIAPDAHVTRRWYYLVPANGEPSKLVHRIEGGRLDHLPGARHEYSGWPELQQKLTALVAPYNTIAMQYSPNNDIMYVSLVDAGTVEFLRSRGKKITTSANMISRFEAVLTARQIETHHVAQRKIDDILAGGFAEIGKRVRADGETSEITMVEWLAEAMRREGLTWEHGPNVSCGSNAADSHYEPTAESSRPIRSGNFVLIDIWGRVDEPGSCYYDITWTGVVGREPSAREHEVFIAVREGRDAAIACVQAAFAAGRPLPGFEADDAAREVIRQRGFGDYFTHRTGHNIAAELHGTGAHLDNLETHDDRLVLPHTCFSVEPGVYIPGEFGVRSEVNMITYPGRAEVTGRIQRELVRI